MVMVVSGAGGPGTLSEAAHALRAGWPLMLLATPPAWRELFAGFDAPLTVCASVGEAMAAIEAQLGVKAGPGSVTATGPTLPVALVQLRAGEDGAANRCHAEAWMERALQPPPGRARPQLLMPPEVWNAPYAAAGFAGYPKPIPEPGSLLQEGPSPSLAMVARLARLHGVNVIAGSIPERGGDGRLFNTAAVIDGERRLRAEHRMLHLFDLDVPGGIRFRESDSLSGGVRITVQPPDGDPLGTGLPQPPGLDLLICCDIPLPELPLLMQQRQGCTLQACPAAFNTTTGPRHWHLLLRARAVNTQCFLLACSSARPMGGDACPSYGHSLVVDPWDSVIFEAGTGEQVLHAELELGQVELARQAIPTSQQRRTDLYRLEQA
jgi:omega-amidase